MATRRVPVIKKESKSVTSCFTLYTQSTSTVVVVLFYFLMRFCVCPSVSGY